MTEQEKKDVLRLGEFKSGDWVWEINQFEYFNEILLWKVKR